MYVTRSSAKVVVTTETSISGDVRCPMSAAVLVETWYRVAKEYNSMHIGMIILIRFLMMLRTTHNVQIL